MTKCINPSCALSGLLGVSVSVFALLGTCPARWAPGDSVWYEEFPKDRVGNAVLGVYTQGGTVVTSGTTDWAHGLRGNDPAVVRITENILARLSK